MNQLSLPAMRQKCYVGRTPIPRMSDPSTDDIFAALYDELQRLAVAQLRRHGPELSLGASTLLHEAWLNIRGRDAQRFPDQSSFMGYAARAMRNLIIDYARRGLAQKRGGGEYTITLTHSVAGVAGADGGSAIELERLSHALDELARVEPALAQLVDLHFFCGYSFVEIAEMRSVSERTVGRDWRKARMILQHTLDRVAGPESPRQ